MYISYKSPRVSWGLPLESLTDTGKAMPWVGLLYMLCQHSQCQNIKPVSPLLYLTI